MLTLPEDFLAAAPEGAVVQRPALPTKGRYWKRWLPPGGISILVHGLFLGLVTCVTIVSADELSTGGGAGFDTSARDLVLAVEEDIVVSRVETRPARKGEIEAEEKDQPGSAPATIPPITPELLARIEKKLQEMFAGRAGVEVTQKGEFHLQIRFTTFDAPLTQFDAALELPELKPYKANLVFKFLPLIR